MDSKVEELSVSKRNILCKKAICEKDYSKKVMAKSKYNNINRDKFNSRRDKQLKLETERLCNNYQQIMEGIKRAGRNRQIILERKSESCKEKQDKRLLRAKVNSILDSTSFTKCQLCRVNSLDPPIENLKKIFHDKFSSKELEQV